MATSSTTRARHFKTPPAAPKPERKGGARWLLALIPLVVLALLFFAIAVLPSLSPTPAASSQPGQTQGVPAVTEIREQGSASSSQAAASAPAPLQLKYPTGEPGWLEEDNGTWYYFDENGNAVTGWKKVNDNWYYFDGTGKLLVDWYQDETGAWYWTNPETCKLAQDGWYEINGIFHAFDANGAWIGTDEAPIGDGGDDLAVLSPAQESVLWACTVTQWPGPGLCAAWVSNVYDVAGVPNDYGNANDLDAAWCHTSDLSKLKPGMMVAVASHPMTEAGSIYGHIGIYVGHGLLMDSGSTQVRTVSLRSWLAWYSGNEAPEWGWMQDIDLSKQS